MAKENNDKSFRDRPINMDEQGKRKWIYAKKPKGKWYLRRSVVAYIWLLFFILAPIIQINGHPFMLIDIANRNFVIFGVIFWAQDTFILALLMLSFVFFIVLFTVTFGRIWCGWACPQTIFLEMVYRKIEYLIEGDSKAQRKLNEGPWNSIKIFKKTLKHGIFIFISVALTNIFILWFTGPDKLWQIMTDPINEHVAGFAIMMLVSAIFYWIYSFFREQICTMVCPYGRMQGVLLDSKSIIVAYDYKRGEPRGTKDGGDCTACNRCVDVCPTGIDIKNGTQLECINCTACIDECNIVMKQVNRPQNLIRFDSIEGIEKGHKSIWNTRNKAYSAVLLLLFGFFIYTLLTRPSLEATILRTPNTIYQIKDDNTLSNLYNIKIVNKTYQDMDVEIKAISPEGNIEIAGAKPYIKQHGLYESVFIFFLDKSKITGEKTEVEFGIYSNGELIETNTVTFVGPRE